MLSIKGHNNSKIAWKACFVDTKHICTRSFQRLDETAHYKFCKTFFENGEVEALNIEDYCPINLQSHRDLFDNLPKDLDKEPIWWLMPWGGTVRNPDLNKEKRIEIKRQYSARFIKLLKSIEKNGFIVDENFNPPVHQLIKGKQTAYILQDGHHRSAIYSYIINHGHQSMLKIVGDEQQASRIKVQNLLIIHSNFLPHLKYTKIGMNNGHFSLSETMKWFNLSFEVLGLNQENPEDTLDYRLSVLHDKFIERKEMT